MSSFDTIEKCVDYLAPIEAFQNLIEFITDQYEVALDELAECPTENLAKQSGKIAAYREILSVLEKF